MIHITVMCERCGFRQEEDYDGWHLVKNGRDFNICKYSISDLKHKAVFLCHNCKKDFDVYMKQRKEVLKNMTEKFMENGEGGFIKLKDFGDLV
jgi:hypothetical protein